MKNKVVGMKNIYGISVLAFIAIVVLLVSCADPSREYSSDLQHFEPTVQFTADVDMYVSPSLETYGETDLFSDNMTARHPVPGTIPRGHMPYLYETFYLQEGLTRPHHLMKHQLNMMVAEEISRF